MNTKEIYKNYPVEVQEYMQNVIDCLVQDYKKIPSSWRVSLDLIADNYNIYLKAKEDVNKNGLLRIDNQGRAFKNQCYAIMTTSQQCLTKLLSNFALTPMSKSKIKNFEAEEDVFDELINS